MVRTALFALALLAASFVLGPRPASSAPAGAGLGITPAAIESATYARYRHHHRARYRHHRHYGRPHVVYYRSVYGPRRVYAYPYRYHRHYRHHRRYGAYRYRHHHHHRARHIHRHHRRPHLRTISLPLG